MILPVVLTVEAEVDFDEAADWYEREAGLGSKFTLQVREALGRIGLAPERHAVLRGDVRRARVPRYPYNIYYRVQADRVVVIAILHGRRDPTTWKDRG